MIELWRWYLPDLEGKLKPSTWRMTEDDAQARYPGCQRVRGSIEMRNDSDGNRSHSFHSGLVRRESDGAMMPPGNDTETLERSAGPTSSYAAPLTAPLRP